MFATIWRVVSNKNKGTLMDYSNRNIAFFYADLACENLVKSYYPKSPKMIKSPMSSMDDVVNFKEFQNHDFLQFSRWYDVSFLSLTTFYYHFGYRVVWPYFINACLKFNRRHSGYFMPNKWMKGSQTNFCQLSQ